MLRLFLFAAGLAVWPVSAAALLSKVYQSVGARKLAGRVEKITSGLDALKNPFLNHARAETLRGQLQPLLALPLNSDFCLMPIRDKMAKGEAHHRHE